MALVSSDKEAWEASRQGYHMTYNGGHHEKEVNEAFHHGMDTVINSLSAQLPDPALCADANAMLAFLRKCNAALCLGNALTEAERLRTVGQVSLFLAKHVLRDVDATWNRNKGQEP